ncbi:MAG: peptidase U32 family protein [Opitutaceae bacterium]|jgi:putative protease
MPTSVASPKIELMAPAGSRASLAAALKAGADSVYFGVGKINMRARAANNFEADDLREIVAKCHRYGAKAYLTLNTILFDGELAEAQDVCRRAKAAGVDAVIAADPAVLQIARAEGLPVHLSVQANVTNLAAVQFYAGFADVIVLARELGLDQIRDIIAGIRERGITGPSGRPVKVEIFAHGALCVAFSGKCQMSLSLYGPKAAATRGACFQPCRRDYLVTDRETGAELVLDGHQVMSPKDLCTLPFLDQILDAGVGVLKIEGRGRAADYVATVVRVYREAIAAWQDGSFAARLGTGAWMADLDSVFNRGFWQGGYYLGKPLGEWTASSRSACTEKKVFVGKITKYYARQGVAEVLVNAEPMAAGTEVWILGETTGAIRVPVKELRVGDTGTPAASAGQGEVAAFAVPVKVRTGDQVYRIEGAGLERPTSNAQR